MFLERFKKKLNKLLDKNLYSPLQTKERNNRIQALKTGKEKAISKVNEYRDFEAKLMEALMTDSREFLMTDAAGEMTEVSPKSKERLRWQMTCTAQILL
jgi:hypothetical protein